MKPFIILRFVVICAILGPFATGCMVKFVSDYDQVLDNSITELQIDSETFFGHLEAVAGTGDAAYAQNLSFYNSAKARLETILMRAQSTPKNEGTISELEDLLDSFDKLRQLHESFGDNGIPPDQVEDLRTALMVHFRAIVTLEIAKKRGN